MMAYFRNNSNIVYGFLWLIVTLGAVALRSSFLSTQHAGTATIPQQQQHLDRPMPGLRFILNKTSQESRLAAQRNHAAKSADSPDVTNAKNAGIKKSSKPLCRRYQVIAGQWFPVHLPKPPYVTNVKHLRCYPSEVYSQSPWRTYKWVPDAAFAGKCAFGDYVPQDFCQLLPRATIAIVGDSLSWEQYRSLVQLHGQPTRQGLQHQSRELVTNVQQSICEGGSTAIVYRRDDYLQNLTASLRQNFPVVLVLNRGAHYVPDDELVADIRRLIEEVRAWLRQCDAMDIQCHFFWRTSVPGHVGCENYTTPVYDLADMEELVEDKSRYDNATIDFHWYDFQHQTQLILQEFFAANLTSFQVLDAYHLNMLRPDEHRAHQGDCLHSCFPGKMDVYNQLLLHFIRMQRSGTDVKRLQAVAVENNWAINVNTVYDEAATKAARAIREAAELAELERLQRRLA